MHEDLTNRQLSILNYIKHVIQTKGYPPAVREIGEAVGLSSSSTVHSHLNQLEKKGYIKRDPTKPRAIEVKDLLRTTREMIDVPVIGQVTAGEPILAVENIEDSFPLPCDFLNTEEVFILKVRGDSMIDAGIHERDMVVVKKQNTANNGDIVVAMLGEEATVKRFFKEKDYIRLQPENQMYEPILTKEIQVLGKVIALLRKF